MLSNKRTQCAGSLKDWLKFIHFFRRKQEKEQQHVLVDTSPPFVGTFSTERKKNRGNIKDIKGENKNKNNIMQIATAELQIQQHVWAPAPTLLVLNTAEIKYSTLTLEHRDQHRRRLQPAAWWMSSQTKAAAVSSAQHNTTQHNTTQHNTTQGQCSHECDGHHTTSSHHVYNQEENTDEKSCTLI